MNKFQIFISLRRHVKLAEARSAMAETNKVAKFFTYIAFFAIAVYIMFFSVMLSLAANSASRLTSCQFFFAFLPFILPIDYAARMVGQHTPAQMIKPYLLLPLRKYDCIDSFIFSAIVTPNNLMWLFLTVPFAIMSVVFSYGFWVALNFVVVFQLIVICNSSFYMLTRTLFNKFILYILIPVAFYAALFAPWYIKNFDAMAYFYAGIGEGVEHGNLLLYIGIAALMFVLFFANRKVQYGNVMAETRNDKDIKLKTISSFSFFDRFHQTGEYLKLELKSMFRNKMARSMFIYSIIFVAFLSLVNSFTDVYDDGFSTAFWSVYPFVLTSINLVRIMCPEGNYIECLLVRKENIRALLEAKYYFYSFMLLMPFVLMLPTVISGKYSLLMLLATMAFTAGPMYCLLMQLAVTNKVTIPLNAKLTRKTGMETNYIQLVVEMLVMFLPIGVMKALLLALGDTGGYLVMLVVGLVFVSLHKFWIGNIYRRMMKRKYENLEGFMSSR